MTKDELVDDVSAEFRSRAQTLREEGFDERGAAIWNRAAGVLQERYEEWALEAVTLSRAARETAYSRSALRKMVNRGDLEDVSDDGTCRVRRGDLPRKATPLGRDAEPELADLRLGRA